MMEESSCGTYRQGARCVEPPLLSTVESEPWRFCVTPINLSYPRAS